MAGAKYKTDNLGRVVESTFKIDKNYATTPNLYNRKNITAIGKLKGGMAGDDGGHLLGQQFGGSSTVLNVVQKFLILSYLPLGFLFLCECV